MIRRSILLVFAVASAGFAQKPDTSAVCWRPRPLAQCRAWVITEAALEAPVSSTSATHLLVGYLNGEGYVSDDFGARLAFTLGFMSNRGSKSAVGFGMSMLNGDLPGRIEARYRRWLDPKTGIDVGFGITGGRVRGVWDPDELSTRGVTGAIGFSGTYLGADARFDYGRTSTHRPVHAAFLTVRTGSRAGPIATAAGFALFIGLLAVLMHGEST